MHPPLGDFGVLFAAVRSIFSVHTQSSGIWSQDLESQMQQGDTQVPRGTGTGTQPLCPALTKYLYLHIQNFFKKIIGKGKHRRKTQGKHLAKRGGPRKIQTIVWEGQLQGRKGKAADPRAMGRLGFNWNWDLLDTNPQPQFCGGSRSVSLWLRSLSRFVVVTWFCLAQSLPLQTDPHPCHRRRVPLSLGG